MFPSLRALLVLFFFFLMIGRPPKSTLFPYPTLFRSSSGVTTRRALIAALAACGGSAALAFPPAFAQTAYPRSEEHTSELQSRQYLVCRLLLEKKKHIALLEGRGLSAASLRLRASRRR